MHHHGGSHAISVLDKVFKSNLPAFAISGCITVVKRAISGVKCKVIKAQVDFGCCSQFPGFLKRTIHSSQLIINYKVGLGTIDLVIEIFHCGACGTKGSVEEIAFDGVTILSFAYIPKHAGCEIITQSIGPPVIAGFRRHESCTLGMKFRDGAL